MKNAVIVSTARTPTGKYGKSLTDFFPGEIGAMCVKEALARSGFQADEVDEAIIGCHMQAGAKANVARQCVIYAGLPNTIPAFTPNKNCATGLKAIQLAANSIQLGDNKVVISGGTDCMSHAPYLIMKGRFGYRMGNETIYDHLFHDAYIDPFCNYHMGVTAENVAKKYNVSREQQDEFSVDSHRKAEKAWNEGKFDCDVIPVEIKQKKSTIIFNRDETYVEDAQYESFAKLKPCFVFDGTGTVTAGNSSPINDEAAAVVLAEEELAKDHGCEILGRYVTSTAAAMDPAYMGYTPYYAVGKLLAKTGLTIDDIGLWEVNEAFASQAVAVCRDLKLPMDKVNVNGGAIALGHPVGATGARLAMTLLREMNRRGTHYGVVTLCIGGGQALASLFELCE